MADRIMTDQSAIDPLMRDYGPGLRALMDALEEPALIVEGSIVTLANGRARRLLGNRLEGHDVRLAIRHPQALEQILDHRPGDLEVVGIAEPGRAWRLAIRELDETTILIRMMDRSDMLAAEKMRVDFVANASHELRTPLSTIGGYAETLAEEDDLSDETRSNFGRIIRDESRRMLRIIEDLMSLSRIEADRFVVPSERVSISDIVQASIASAGVTRSACQCRIETELPENLPPVRGDRGQLIQVLDNLLGNALRYGCDKTDPSIELRAATSGGWLTISVTDHGPGISREHLPRITERFYRVDAARSHESGGTGLGLAIVKHIIERHKGSLEIRSTVGTGTTVSVHLPIAT
jgi:two-component system, OmpR family, phosphate regulon sensor histidine kinase PhoR